MSQLNSLQTEQVRAKVLYSEVDVPYNGYLEALGKVTKLAKSILNGGLQSYESQEKVQFGIEHVQEMETNANLKFMEYQSSLDVKKLSQENWEQSNNETIEFMESNMPDMIGDLRSTHEIMQERIERLRVLYDSVNKVNVEAENLLEGNTSLTATLSEWEKELGASLADKLIKKGYLREAGSSGGESRYRAYDNFTKGPKELKHMNRSIKGDISRLTKELVNYKEKWLNDAEIFTRITSVLKEELIKRDMSVDIDMEEEEEDDDEEEEEEEEEVEEEDDGLEEVGGESQQEHGDEQEDEEEIEEEDEDEEREEERLEREENENNANELQKIERVEGVVSPNPTNEEGNTADSEEELKVEEEAMIGDPVIEENNLGEPTVKDKSTEVEGEMSGTPHSHSSSNHVEKLDV